MATTPTQHDPALVEAFKKAYGRRLQERADAMAHPGGLLDHVLCIDPKTGERFSFTLNDPEAGWYWQREVLDEWIKHPLSLVLKARQIGITWLAAGYALWKLLTMPHPAGRPDQRGRGDRVVNRIFTCSTHCPTTCASRVDH